MEKYLILQNEISEISHLAIFVEEIAGDLSLSGELTNDLLLVLEEAVSNVIQYADDPGEIALSARTADNKLIFTLTDSGNEFDPTMISEPDLTLSVSERKIGGLGIFLIRHIMNKVEYQRIEGKNIFTLTKEI